jgi:hypothetical protein
MVVVRMTGLPAVDRCQPCKVHTGTDTDTDTDKGGHPLTPTQSQHSHRVNGN